MATDHIRYDILAQDALRGMVRTVLEDIAKGGLPGEHHFYITFNTGADGVRVSQRMRAQYPQDMTIVLQHQFWDLKVTEDEFEVGLSFGGVPERLVVPFAAITAFADPSVQFALQFEALTLPGGEADAEDTAAQKPKPPLQEKNSEKNQEKNRDKASGGRTSVPSTRPSNPPADAERSSETPQPPDDKPGAEVVRLDRFRKK